MSFWRFLGSWFARVFSSTWGIVEIVERVSALAATVLAGLSAFNAWHGEKPMWMIVAPLVGAALIIVFAFLYHAYSLYREEFDKRAELEGVLVPKLEFAGIGQQTDG